VRGWESFRINLFRINPAYGLAGHAGLAGLVDGCFSFFSCPAIWVVPFIPEDIADWWNWWFWCIWWFWWLFLIFFSLCLQLVLLQRIVDIYVCTKKKEFFVASDSGATTWRIGLLETHFRWFEAHHKQNASSNSKYLES
jgi:hypothetical protein